MKNFRTICFCLVAASVWLTNGCKKPESTNTVEVDEPNISRSFTCPDSCWLNDIVYFRPDSATLSVSSNTYLWSFGDGAVSTSSYTAHPYAAPGTYTVTMTVNANVKTRAARVLQIIEYTGPYFMDSMNVPRHWMGTNSINWGNTNPVNDTLLNVDVVDSGKVKVKDVMLSFSSMDRTEGSITYSDHFRSTLIYYYLVDSMQYHYTWQSDVGHGGQMLHLHTK